MNIIHLDDTPPFDDCQATRSIQTPQRAGLCTKLKKSLKGLIYRRLSGRPKRFVPPIPEAPKCVLVATGGNLGGAIISLPLIEGIRKRWPNTHLAVVSNRQHGLDIVKRAGLGDSFYLAPQLNLNQFLFNSAYWQFRRAIRNISPEVYISNFNFSLDHTLPLREIPITIGQLFRSQYDVDDSNQPHIFDIWSYMEPGLNWLEGYWGILDNLGINYRSMPLIQVSENELLLARRSVEALCGANNMTLVGIQASVWEKQLFKAWPVTHVAELCDRLWSELRIHLLIIGAPGQEALGDYLRHKYPDLPFIDGVGKFSVAELPDVVACCAAVVTNDSGLMHLAASVGTPTLAIYGMTDPAITWVYGDDARHRIVRRSGCKPCYGWGKNLAERCPTRHCLKNISTDAVLKELLAILRPLTTKQEAYH